MFVQAGHHERAIRLLFGKDFVDDGARVLLTHRTKLDSAIQQELLDYCRSYYFNAYDYGALPPLFDFSLEEELLYARNNNLRPQLMYLLKEHGLFIQLAAVHLEERMPVDALGAFLDDFSAFNRTSSLSEGVQVVIGYAEDAFSLESRKSAESLKNLRKMLDKLKHYDSSLHPRQKKELQLFSNLVDHHKTVDSARASEWDQSDSEERLRKIMLLHLALSNMDWLPSRSSSNESSFRDFLHAWKTYNYLIAPIFEAAEPSRLSMARRLLGFRPSRPDLYINTHFIVSEESVIYEYSKRQRVPVQRSSNGDIIFPARWVDKLIRDGLRTPLDQRLRRFYDRIDRPGWAPTTPRLNLSEKPAKTLEPMTTFYPGYHGRLHAILIALDLLAPICHTDLQGSQSINPSLLRLWTRRLFDIVYPGNGMIGEIDPTWVSIYPSIMSGPKNCVEQYLKRIDAESTFNAKLSSLIIGHSLVMQLKTHSVGGEKLHLTKAKFQGLKGDTQADVLDTHRTPLENTFNSIFDRSNTHGLTNTANIIGDALKTSSEPIDISTLVYLVELVTCDMIFHLGSDAVSQSRFSDLILPFSWARLLAEQYCSTSRSKTRDTSSLPDFLDSIVILSEQLKYNTERDWLVGEMALPGQSDIVETFNLRLCWCIVLIIVNSIHPVVFSDLTMSSLIHIAGDQYGRIPKTPCQ
ncbi:unnamed protein product, partial [Rhizoctonia solani]